MGNLKKWFVIACCAIAVIIGFVYLLNLCDDPIVGKIAVIFSICSSINSFINEQKQNKHIA